MTENEKAKIQIGEQIWLEFFNDILAEKHIITAQERDRMSAKISIRNAKKGNNSYTPKNC